MRKRKQATIELARQLQLLSDRAHADFQLKRDWRRVYEVGVAPAVRACHACKAVYHREPVPAGYRLVNPLPFDTPEDGETAA